MEAELAGVNIGALFKRKDRKAKKGDPRGAQGSGVVQPLVRTAHRPGAEKSFLIQIALRVAAHARRNTARRREVFEAEPLERIDTKTPEQIISQKRAREILDRILDALDPDLRAIFILYEFEQMTMAEIATTLDIPPGTVASHLRRARTEFRERASVYERDYRGSERAASQTPSDDDTKRPGLAR